MADGDGGVSGGGDAPSRDLLVILRTVEEGDAPHIVRTEICSPVSPAPLPPPMPRVVDTCVYFY